MAGGNGELGQRLLSARLQEQLGGGANAVVDEWRMVCVVVRALLLRAGKERRGKGTNELDRQGRSPKRVSRGTVDKGGKWGKVQRWL